MDGKMNQNRLLLCCLQLILRSGVCPETKPHEWVKLLLYLHSKGWLYVFFEEDKLAFVGSAYRVPDEWDYDKLPEKEEGDNLYIPFIVSFSTDKNLPLKMIKRYLAKYGEVKKVIFFERNSPNKYKEFSRENIGDKENVETESPEHTGSPAVPV